MMRKGFYLLMCLATLLMASCNSDSSAKSGSSSISGTINNAADLSVFLDHVSEPNSNTSIQSTKADANGNFAFNLTEKPEAGIYRIRIGSKKGFLILDGSENDVKINGDLNNFNKNDFTVEGSSSTSDLNQAMADYLARKMDVNKIGAFVKSTKNPFTGAQLAMQILKLREDFAAIHRVASDRINAEYPESSFGKNYNAQVAGLEQKLRMKTAQEKIKIGAPAPDIKAKSPDGKEYALSELKGQVVLLDFWASWCGPCRKANPHVVETYKKYKDKGFTVFSVSLDGIDSRSRKSRYPNQSSLDAALDQQKTRWVNAINKDKLEWAYHVSNLQKWEEPAAQQYGVRGIPKTFLIDRDGKIAAINPRYDLEEQLTKLL